MKRFLVFPSGYVLAVFALLHAPSTADAKPMAPATLEQAVQYPHIVVCAYDKYDDTNPKEYFSGVIAQYYPTTVLKGGKLTSPIQVRYLFHDCSPCLAPPNWKFDAKTMPKKGSKWILFFKNGSKASDPYNTYRGNFGRLAATPQNLQRVQKLLQKQ